MAQLKGKQIAILATNGFEQSELFSPRERLSEAGAQVSIVSPEGGSIRGWEADDWGDSVKVDSTLEDADLEEFHALVLPGGVMNPDQLRIDEQALACVQAFFDKRKVVAAICHAPWILINAGVVVGRNLTSFPSLRLDLENAGAKWRDEAVVVDNGVITSRRPNDLEEFNSRIIDELCEQERRSAA